MNSLTIELLELPTIEQVTIDTRQELKRFQEVLGLEDKDIESIGAKLGLLREEVQAQRMSEKYQPFCLRPLNPPILGDFEIGFPPKLGARGAVLGAIGTSQTSS